MLELDRKALTQVLSIPALRLPKHRCHEVLRKFKGYTFDRPKHKCVIQDESAEDWRLLLLKETLELPGGLSLELQSLLREEAIEVSTHQVVLTYEHHNVEQVLRTLLPPDVEVPVSFETVGHIAHFNLKPEQLPYKHIIGQVVLDKNPHLRTVVSKVGNIENEYRVFLMEVIAGEPGLVTEVTQHGARFQLDFSQVYWNSRLEAEHSRLVSLFRPGEVVVDMMAGIGPFAIPAARQGCQVYANDLNPDSVRWMLRNITLNRVDARVKPFNMDARCFVRMLLGSAPAPPDNTHNVVVVTEPANVNGTADPSRGGAAQGSDDGRGASPSHGDDVSVAEQTQQRAGGERMGTSSANGDGQVAAAAPAAAGGCSNGSGRGQAGDAGRGDEPPPGMPPGFVAPVVGSGGLLFQHAVMNLPASAVEFLDAFRGVFDRRMWQGRPLPLVHCYTFRRSCETDADIIAKAEHYLGGRLDSPAVVHLVRDVAPNKAMLCLSFRVPKAVAFGTEDALPFPPFPVGGMPTSVLTGAGGDEERHELAERSGVGAAGDVAEGASFTDAGGGGLTGAAAAGAAQCAAAGGVYGGGASGSVAGVVVASVMDSAREDGSPVCMPGTKRLKLGGPDETGQAV